MQPQWFKLLKKNTTWTWSSIQSEAFEKLKMQLQVIFCGKLIQINHLLSELMQLHME